MKILLIFLTIFFVWLTICEAGKKKRLPKKKEKGSSSQNPPSVIDPVVKAIRDFKMKNLDDWERFDYLKSYLEEPKETGDYDKMVNEAKEKLLKDKENTLTEFLENVKRALQGRKLRYVRLIGPGSMHGHSNHYLYREDKGRNKAREVFLSFSEKYKKLFIKSSQIRAVYQFAVQILTIEHFDNQQNPKKEEIKLKHKGKAIASSSGTNISEASIIGTFEELYINESEKKYIEGKYKIIVIIPEVKKNSVSTNLYKIPSIVDKMEADEATLIIMLECPFDMTKEIINSYKIENKLKNLIIVETSIGNELKRNPIEIINFSNDNKLEILQAFPHSTIVENLLAGAFIYYNKREDEELDKLIVPSQEVKKEDVKVDVKEKVEDERKEEMKDGVRDDKKKGVKVEKAEDVKVEVKEKNEEDKKQDDKKKDVKSEKNKVKLVKDEDNKKKEVEKHDDKNEGTGVSDEMNEDVKVEMKKKFEDEKREEKKEEVKDVKNKEVGDEQKEKVKVKEKKIEDEMKEEKNEEVKDEKKKGAKDEQKEDVKVEEDVIEDEIKEEMKEQVKEKKKEVNEEKKEKVEE